VHIVAWYAVLFDLHVQTLIYHLFFTKDLRLKYTYLWCFMLWSYNSIILIRRFSSNQYLIERSAERNVNGRRPGAMSPQPFFRILTPAADELGYHLTVTTRDSCSFPFARLAYIISFLRCPKKPKRFHMVKKKIQKTAYFVSNNRMFRGRDERGVIIGRE